MLAQQVGENFVEVADAQLDHDVQGREPERRVLVAENLDQRLGVGWGARGADAAQAFEDALQDVFIVRFQIRITSYNVCYTKLLRSRGSGCLRSR